MFEFFKKNKKKKLGQSKNTTFCIAPSSNISNAYQLDSYSNDIFRAGIDAIARNVAKLKGSYVVNTSSGHSIRNCTFNHLLQVAPNAYMTSYDLLYKLVTHLYLNNNAFILIDRNVAR